MPTISASAAETVYAARHYPALHLLRLAAALSIFVGHWSEPYVTQLWPQGQIAIDAFFMAEGFLAMQMLSAPSARRQVDKRIVDRIVHVYPAYALGLCAGFCAFASSALADQDGWTTANWLAAFVAGLFLLPTFSTLVHGSVFPLNPPSWAIVLELIGFVLLAVTQRSGSRRALGTIWAGSVLLFLMLAIRWHDPNAGWATTHYWGGLPRMLFGFFGGAILYPLHGRFGALVPELSPAILCALFLLMHLPTIRFVGWPLLGLGVPLLVLFAASSRNPAWSRAVGAWSARNALTLYLLGYPVTIIWRSATLSRLHNASAAGIALDFALVFSSLVLLAIVVDRIRTRLDHHQTWFGRHD